MNHFIHFFAQTESRGGVIDITFPRTVTIDRAYSLSMTVGGGRIQTLMNVFTKESKYDKLVDKKCKFCLKSMRILNGKSELGTSATV